MSFLAGLPVNNQSLNGIISITDGSDLVIENGNITNVNNLQLQNLEIDDLVVDVSASTPLLKTSNILSENGLLNIGTINDEIQIIGNNIKFIGNVTSYESANVIIADHSIDLNATGYGNLTLENAGINILGDANSVVSSLLTDNNGDWFFTSPNNKVTIGNLEVSSLNVLNPTSYDNFQSANITATNKFITQGRAFLNNTTSYTSSTTHLNSTYVKANEINIGKGIRFLQQPHFVIDKGTFTGTTTGNYTITFNMPFTSSPTCNVSCERNSSNHAIIWIVSVSATQLVVRVANSANTVISPATIHWIAYGSV